MRLSTCEGLHTQIYTHKKKHTYIRTHTWILTRISDQVFLEKSSAASFFGAYCFLGKRHPDFRGREAWWTTGSGVKNDILQRECLLLRKLKFCL